MTAQRASAGAPPTVLVPVQAPALGLDACLAALERSLPDGAPVLVADDASEDPRIGELASGWCARTRLGARYLRRERALGLAANCAAALAESDADADLVLLRGDGEPTAGWLAQLQRAAAAEPRAAMIAAWSGEGELAGFADAAPAATIADAAASLDWPSPPALPAAAGPALYIRRSALRAVGGLDCETFAGWCAFDDLGRRAEAFGWRMLLCPSAFVAGAPGADSGGTLGEIERLQARWPDFQERVARFILEDPLRPLRERLRARIAELARGGPQRDLFDN